MLSMDEEKYLTISDTSDLIDSGTDNFKTGQFNDIIIHEGRFVQIPGFKITSIFHILPYYPLCDARYAPGQSETNDFSTISQSDYVLQQWRCNKWRSKYPSELVSYERTVWPITISTCPVYVGIHQQGLCFQHIWTINGSHVAGSSLGGVGQWDPLSNCPNYFLLPRQPTGI